MVVPLRRRSVPRKSLSGDPTLAALRGEKERLRERGGDTSSVRSSLARSLAGYTISQKGKRSSLRTDAGRLLRCERTFVLELERSTPVLSRRAPRSRPPLIDDNTADYFYILCAKDNGRFVR